mmetsp:Transcript_6646/g.9493  ORF Transcript_6646/g.9493 Transcript_6646/m.9493 type:complete len:348 (+) Transcript_6646:259-1302(+)
MGGYKTTKSSIMHGVEYFTTATTTTTTPQKVVTCNSGVGVARTSASLSTRVSSDGSSSSSGRYQQNYLSQFHQSPSQLQRTSSPHAHPPRLHSTRSYNDYQEHYAFPPFHEDPKSQQGSKKTASSYTPNTTDTTLSMSINSSYADDEVDGLFNDEIQDLVGSNIENFKQKIHRSQRSYGSNSGIQSAATGVITVGTSEDSIFGLLEGMKDPHYSPHAHIVGVVGEDDDNDDGDEDDEESTSHNNDSSIVQHENVVFEQGQDPTVLSSSLPSRGNSFTRRTTRSRSRSFGKKRSRSQTIFRQKPQIYQERDRLRQQQQEYERMRGSQGILRSMLSSCCQNECLSHVDD